MADIRDRDPRSEFFAGCTLATLLALASYCGGAFARDEVSTSKLIAVQAGGMPIVVSAPHGGQEPIPGAAERTGEGLARGPGGFVTGRDVNTNLLALEFANALEAKMGKKPFLVVAQFQRKYADANRPAHLAYEDDHARQVYEDYHSTLDRYCREVQKTFGRGLLLDIHGQGSARDTVFRGTRNGQTVARLIEQFGETAHNGPQSFFGLLDNQGWKVFPLNGEKERAGFTGGYIVQTYSGPYGLDAIQLEFGGDYTDKNKLRSTATNLVEATHEFAKRYLLLKAKP